LLANQFKILEALDPKQAERYRRLQTIFEEGYPLEYGEVFTNIADGLSHDGCSEVVDILQMYRDLKWSFDKLSDRSSIDADDIDFPGFDGNNESEQMAYAEFVVQRGDRFAELGDQNLNSHYPSIDGYRRMLAVWRRFRKSGGLSSPQIAEILAARAAP